MATSRQFQVEDLFNVQDVNMDELTETYHNTFYSNYFCKWPDLFIAKEAPDGSIMGYIIGKAEGKGERWHGHVSSVSVAPEFRRLGLAKSLMDGLEEISEKDYDTYFVDLYVRESNSLAIGFYEKLKYVKYRQVIGYYSSDNEDAYDMRKALRRDKDKKSEIPLPHPVYPGEYD